MTATQRKLLATTLGNKKRILAKREATYAGDLRYRLDCLTAAVECGLPRNRLADMARRLKHMRAKYERDLDGRRRQVAEMETALSKYEAPQSSQARAARERAASLWERYKALGTLDAVGAEVGLTRERVRQLFAKHGYSVAAERKARRRAATVPTDWPLSAEETRQAEFDSLVDGLIGRTVRDGECWIWTGGVLRLPSGHQMPKARGVSPDGVPEEYTHRLMYTLFRGEIPEGMSVIRTCHQMLCICPEHLMLATKTEVGQHKTEEAWSRIRSAARNRNCSLSREERHRRALKSWETRRRNGTDKGQARNFGRAKLTPEEARAKALKGWETHLANDAIAEAMSDGPAGTS